MIPVIFPMLVDDNDLESGCPSASSSRSSSFYSQVDESEIEIDISATDHRRELDAADILISKKFIALHNDDGSSKPPRRLSQCLQLVSRRSRSSVTLLTPMQPTRTSSANFHSNTTKNSPFHQVWETVTIPWRSPVKSQCSVPHQSSSSAPLNHRLFITVLIAMFIATSFGSTLLLRNQQRQISSLQSQLTIINQHRLFLEKKQTELITQLRYSDVSLEQCKYAQKQMASAHETVSKTMGTLRQEYTETKELLVRCQEVEDRV